MKMDDKELEQKIKEVIKYEDEKLMEIVNNDPRTANAKAPDDLYNRLFSQIHEYEEEQEKIKEQEMARLEKKYKRTKRWNKIVILVAAIVCVLAFGVTSMGGPKRVLEKFTRTIAGREQSTMDTDDDRTEEVKIVSEAEAYEKIDEKFGVYPVKLNYLPEDMYFVEVAIEEEAQNARLYYEKDEEMMIAYTIWFNYRTVSTGTDVEDSIINQYEKEVQGNQVIVKQYSIEENGTTRWRAEFKFNDMQCYLLMTGLDEAEVKKIVENLYFLQ